MLTIRSGTLDEPYNAVKTSVIDSQHSASTLRPEPPQKRRDRTGDVVQAACSVIARYGLQRLTMQAVANEAQVSKTLVHYYFPARSQLLAAAYAYAETRALERARSEIADVSPGARRLQRLLHLYLDDESTIREDWILWSELSNSALFDAELTLSVEAAYRNWAEWISSLVEQGIADGSISAGVTPDRAGIAVTAAVEGLNSLLMLHLLTRETALELIDTFLEQLGIPTMPPARRDGEGAPDGRALDPLAHDLVAIALQALRGLDRLAADSRQRAKVSRVRMALTELSQNGW